MKGQQSEIKRTQDEREKVKNDIQKKRKMQKMQWCTLRPHWRQLEQSWWRGRSAQGCENKLKFWNRTGVGTGRLPVSGSGRLPHAWVCPGGDLAGVPQVPSLLLSLPCRSMCSGPGPA